MTKELHPAGQVGGTLMVPGDKSIAHRIALSSILADNPITATNWPDTGDVARSIAVAEAFGVATTPDGDAMVFAPPASRASGTIECQCGNSGTTVRLAAGLAAGCNGLSARFFGDESLSRRPMKRIVTPLTEMGAEVTTVDDRLPMTVGGRSLLPFTYRLPVASAQVKSSILLAGLSAGCSVEIEEPRITRDHTERLLRELNVDLVVEDVKPILEADPDDPRRKRQVMPHDYRRRIILATNQRPTGGEIDIPGDISTAAFFFVLAAISGADITVQNVGLNPTRTAILDHLRQIGASVAIRDKHERSGEPRGTVTVSGGTLKPRKIEGDTTVGLIDEIPIVAVAAAYAKGTTVIRDAAELRVKETDRLQAIYDNLSRMGVKVGLMEDGLVIEGRGELQGADLAAYGDHRIAMAMAIAATGAVGPSLIDDPNIVGVSCPSFWKLLDGVTS